MHKEAPLDPGVTVVAAVEAPAAASRVRSTYGRILKGSGIYTIATLVHRMSSVVMLPVFTHFLTADQYGTMEILDLSLNVFGMLFGANFSVALFYHYFEATSKRERDTVVSTTLLGSASLGALAAAIGFALARQASVLLFQHPNNAGYLRIMLLNFGFTLLLEAVLQWLRATDQARIFVVVAVCRTVIAMTLNIVFLAALGKGLAGVLYSALITSSLLALVSSAYCLTQIKPALDFRLFRRLIRYSIPVTLTGVALFVIHYVDRFILQRFVTMAEIGVYALAYKIGMLVSNFHLSFQSYWTSQMFTLLQGKTGEQLFSSVFTYMLLFLAVIGLLLTVFSGPGLIVLSRPEYWGARALVPYIVVAYVVRAIGDYFRVIFYTENRPGLDARLNWIGAAVCMAAYLVLIPLFKVWGAIAATFLAFGFIAVLGFSWIRQLRRLDLEWGRVTKIGVASSLVILASHLVPAQPLSLSLPLNALAFTLFPLTLWSLRFANDSERQTLSAGWGRAVQTLRAVYPQV
jgi:O-antigen/teichoic acid export membrane protein